MLQPIFFNVYCNVKIGFHMHRNTDNPKPALLQHCISAAFCVSRSLWFLQINGASNPVSHSTRLRLMMGPRLLPLEGTSAISNVQHCSLHISDNHMLSRALLLPGVASRAVAGGRGVSTSTSKPSKTNILARYFVDMIGSVGLINGATFCIKHHGVRN